ncbi:hypothetical protein Y032_0009g473 [Ancylostoma ceylanicum]|uniref:Uncharacterized protein n=1 Tax=Ancylostoma ceylanicum TaxID=53326 RepID=A0A016VJ20_9BILA|nr:hypothetical protein Y032_0009g473 [Ancylostoma ceylanicum]
MLHPQKHGGFILHSLLVNKGLLTMSVVEIVIFIVGLLFSLMAHCLAWAIHTKVSKVLERLKDCDDNVKAAAKLVENSAITGSVLQLSAEQLRFDPDVNEFERDVAVLMLKDPQLTYTGETMHRPNRPKTPVNQSRKSLKKQVSLEAAPKRKQDSEEPMNTVTELKTMEKDVPKVPAGKEAMKQQESSDDEKNPNKKKFKPPPNIAKADAKDPAYETLQGIGNELFKGEKEKEKSKEEGSKDAEKKKFKQPSKVQKADAKDPQYETLADVKDDIFKG